MNIEKRALLLANQIARIDNAMCEVRKMTNNRHSIKFHKEEPFRVLQRLKDIMQDCHVIAGRSYTFRLMNCSVNFKRDPKTN